ncbi:hypothetical protein EON66_01280 [archaeon]|nr:MAG: hypothetical protein EON66_01280 [archaeon]
MRHKTQAGGSSPRYRWTFRSAASSAAHIHDSQQHRLFCAHGSVIFFAVLPRTCLRCRLRAREDRLALLSLMSPVL